jgi:Type VI secretion system effector, Hcp
MHKLLLLVGTLLIGLGAQAAPGDVFLLQIPTINGAVNLSPLDTTSPELALAAASGKRFATVTLAALSGGNDHEFLRFMLKNATITSV